MKLKNLLLLPLILLLTAEASAIGITITRCSDDQLNTPNGLRRHEFGLKCISSYSDAVERIKKMNFVKDEFNPWVMTDSGENKRTYNNIDDMDFKVHIPGVTRSPEQGYPSFNRIDRGSVMELVEYKNTLDASTSCDAIPDNVEATRICPAGCYLGTQFVLFGSKYLPIEKAKDSDVSSLVTLSAHASIDHLEFQKTPLQQIIQDNVLSEQEFIYIQTQLGEITVTPQHPMLKNNGYMVTAGNLEIGDKLLRVTGEGDTVLSIRSFRDTAYAYNVVAKSDQLQNRIVVSQDFLTGDLYFQNAGTKYLNRLLLRQLNILQ